MASPWRIVAMKERDIRVAAICIPKQYVVFENGLQLPINEWQDAKHRPIRNGWRARYYEFGDDENGYGIGDMDAYEMPSYKDH